MRFAQESYRVATLISTDWRVDLTVATSESSKHSASVQLKLELDTQPHKPQADPTQIDGVRIKEFAFELDTDKLDVLLHELLHAQTLMESVEN